MTSKSYDLLSLQDPEFVFYTNGLLFPAGKAGLALDIVTFKTSGRNVHHLKDDLPYNGGANDRPSAWKTSMIRIKVKWDQTQGKSLRLDD